LYSSTGQPLSELPEPCANKKFGSASQYESRDKEKLPVIILTNASSLRLRRIHNFMSTANTIVIASTFTADPITDSIQFWLDKLQMTGRVVMAPPFQVLQTLIDPTSLLRANAAGLNVILVRWTDLTQRDQFAASVPGDDLAAALHSCADENRVPHLVILCASPCESGSSSQEPIHKEWNHRLIHEFATHTNVLVITAREIQSLYPVAHAHDSYSDGLAAIPYTPAGFAAIGTMIARKYHMLNQPPYKVIAVDCDNTLWTGVCGEDGPEGIVLDPPRLILQKHLLDQHQMGKLLCLCSKNNAEDVLAVFHGRQEMPLRLEHFISQRINWEPKAENLTSLARELGVSADSFIFLDDSPIECEVMRTTLPEVLTLQIPARAADIPEFLRHGWAFDRAKATKEDQQRTVLYHQAKERESLRKTVATIDDFLASLDLKLDFQSVNEIHLARASQLTYRVNQFNLSTIRRTEAELAAMLKQPDFNGLLIGASDRFGDYGIVGLILHRWGSDTLEVDTFVLSCRALGRGVEHRIVAELAAIAKTKGLKTLVLRLTLTPKNQPARDFLDTEFATYSQRDGESLVYQIPVEIAQDARPRSSAAIQAPAEAPPDFTQPPRFEAPRAPAARSVHLAEIATAMTDGDKILSHIESWKRNSQATPEVDGIAPRTEIEQTLANIWAVVLGWETIKIRDNFLTLGGDSLKMVQVIVQIYDQFGVEFPIATFFDSLTIEAQALKLAQLLASDIGS
ncbi:MAG: HAD-IIIC family phosphatase, partial [Candidatus Binatia bacterium]